MKWILAVFLSFLSVSSFAANNHFKVCPGAAPTSASTFCDTFKKSASCHCSDVLPEAECQSMHSIYLYTIARFPRRGLQDACEYQHEVPTQTCLDDWSCQLNGGVDSHGGKCNATGLPCGD